MGKASLEGKIHEELSSFLNELTKQNGRSFNLHPLLPMSISNIICSITFGSRFEYDDPVFQKNVVGLFQSVRSRNMIQMVNFLPFLEFLPKIFPEARETAINVKGRAEYAREQIDAHIRDYDPDNPRDFIDVYMKKMHVQQDQSPEECTFDGID